MADTNHSHAPSIPVEGDGVNYRGIFWFIVILTVTTLFCQALVWGFFKFFEHRVDADDVARSPLTAPTGTPPPGPNLLTDEPGNLHRFRENEDTVLSHYGYINKDLGSVHIPIDVAKKKVLDKGLPTRPAAASTPPSAPAEPGKAAPAEAAAGAAGKKGGLSPRP